MKNKITSNMNEVNRRAGKNKIMPLQRNFPNQKNYSGLISENVEALAGPTELPELVVTCDKDEGQCWKESNVEATCPDNTKYKECYFDGAMSEYCSSPC